LPTRTNRNQTAFHNQLLEEASMGAFTNDELPGPGIGTSTIISDHTRCPGGRACILHASIGSTAQGAGTDHADEFQAFIELAGHCPYDAVTVLVDDSQNRAS
jgi:hypothetical protein